jgi:hypothetical protein
MRLWSQWSYSSRTVWSGHEVLITPTALTGILGVEVVRVQPKVRNNQVKVVFRA